MRLSDTNIVEEMRKGDLSIDPFDAQTQLQPASVDLRLGSSYAYPPKNKNIDLREYEPSQKMGMADEEIVIGPNEKLLCTTKETVTIPDYMDAIVMGRSSIGRLFMHIHTAGYVDPGYKGEITLELVNHTSNEYTLPVGMRCCQLIFTYLHTPCSVDYGEKSDQKYQNQAGATRSSISNDF